MTRCSRGIGVRLAVDWGDAALKYRHDELVSAITYLKI